MSEEYDRAAPQGTGHVKAGGNYAADLEPLIKAKELGCGTTLYLDAKEKRYIEEFSVSNFAGICGNKCDQYVDNMCVLVADYDSCSLSYVHYCMCMVGSAVDRSSVYITH